MSIRTILPAAAAVALALMPAMALAQLQVNANGFERVVVGSMQNGSCDALEVSSGTLLRCPDGSRGTLTLFRHEDDAPACEVDFWYDSAHGSRPWHIQLSHQSGTNGTCATQWQGATTLNVSASP
jgi:hypothetical protein